MADKKFFPQRPDFHPMIYAYEENNPQYKGLLKIGYTAVDVEKRIAQQYPVKRPDGGLPYRIVLEESAMRPDGTSFTDHDVHRMLENGRKEHVGGEWFRCTPNDVKAAVVAVRNRTENVENRTQDFKMRPEQEEAVRRTAEYFIKESKSNPSRSPKFLWNAKMRFGKTFTAYQLAKRMNLKKILVLTFKPVVEDSWEKDLSTHVDFAGWQFYSHETAEKTGVKPKNLDPAHPIVCFGSFQDLLGTNDAGGIKVKNEWIHTMNWDIVVFDEYHFGAWRDSAKELFEPDDDDDYDTLDMEKYKEEEADDAYNETFLPITSSYYLYLSGTPFRALHSGEFIEDQIFNWTYSDEQREKEKYANSSYNPYAALPRMVMMTYKIPDSIRQIAVKGEFNEFNLNEFFSASGNGKDAHFVYENYVQKWLDLIRGAYLPSSTDDLKLGRNERPAMPYSDTRLLSVLSHTLWFLPNVSSCYAMKNLLEQKQNVFYHEYKINVCAGKEAGIGLSALGPVLKSMGDPLKTKTITLSCGKLTTGVTIPQWSGIFMLRDLSSPETYFQAAFRVQSPWEITIDGGHKEIMKRECYIFDFSLDRALREIADYSRGLNIAESNPEKNVGEFINFLPVLAYDGSTMKQISASEILDITMAGTSATLLARRWESALLVNVDNDTLKRLMENPAAMKALMKIEGFRSLNSDIETIINKSEAVKKVKKEDKKLTQEEKNNLSDEEKEFKSKRKKIREKLIKFATRIPVFMYLTDFREHSLQDVITQLEPGLFKKVTGLEVNEFDLLVSLGLFNREIMNDAVYKFRRYEDASLSYTGIDKHRGQNVGLYDTVLTRKDYDELAAQQIGSMVPVPANTDDLPDKALAPGSVKNGDNDVTTPVTLSSGIAEAKPLDSDINHSKREAIRHVRSNSDYSSIKAGTILLHKKFGKGTVVCIKNGLILVKFNNGEKKFEFPSAFENGFLKLI